MLTSYMYVNMVDVLYWCTCKLCIHSHKIGRCAFETPQERFPPGSFALTSCPYNMSAPKRRHMNGKYKDILAEQLAAAEARDALGSAASLPIGDGSPTPSILDIDSDSDSEDDSSTNSDDVRFEMEDAPDDQPATSAMTQSFGRVQSHPSNITVPDKSYFDMRGDKEKRAYIESFCDILGRIKTNHHFRCKGCGETFVGQYLNMLVHMSGTNNHLSVRTRYCKNPIPAIRDKILQDYADYNAKQQLYNSHVKAEPGTKPSKQIVVG